MSRFRFWFLAVALCVLALGLAGCYGSVTKYALTITASPAEGGTTSGQGSQYVAGTVVPLVAAANPGYVFAGWQGANASDVHANNITMNDNKSLTALFTAVPPTPAGPSISSYQTWGSPAAPCYVKLYFDAPTDPTITKVRVYRYSESTTSTTFLEAALLKGNPQVWQESGTHLQYGAYYQYWIVPLAADSTELAAGAHTRIRMAYDPATTLLAPDGVTIHTGTTGTGYYVRLAWSAVADGGVGGPFKYRVSYKVGAGTYTELPDQSSTTVDIPFASPGSVVTCRVRTLDSASNLSPWSGEFSIDVGGKVPQAPVMSYCEVQSAHTIQITWSAVSSDVNGNLITVKQYNVHRQASGGPDTVIATRLAGQTTTVTLGSQPVGQFSYWVTTVSDSDIESGPSNKQSQTFGP